MVRRIPSRLMPHKVRIREKLGQGAEGDVYAAHREYRAYIEDRQQVVMSGSAQEETSSTQVWVDPEVPIREGSLVTPLYGESAGRELRIVRHESFNHPSAPAHHKLYLGSL